MPIAAPDPFEVRPPTGVVVFRVLDTRDASPGCFLSDEQDERTQTLLRSNSMALYRGFSTRANLAQARSLARSLRKNYVAEVELDWTEGDAIARTFKTSGHHTVWAHPDLIVGRVRDIHDVSA